MEKNKGKTANDNWPKVIKHPDLRDFSRAQKLMALALYEEITNDLKGNNYEGSTGTLQKSEIRSIGRVRCKYRSASI